MDAGYARHAAAIGSASRVETQHIETHVRVFLILERSKIQKQPASPAKSIRTHRGRRNSSWPAPPWRLWLCDQVP
jgi:hypothetical protein